MDLGKHTMSDEVERGKLRKPMDNTNYQMMSGVACHHSIWTQHTVEQRLAWNFIIAIGQHIMSDNIGRDMSSSLLYSTYE